MGWRHVKAWSRRRRLARHGIAPELRVATARYGARSGLWTVATEGLHAGSVVYSFGVGDNLAWELAMVERFGLIVHAFDPTPRSVRWVAEQALPPGLRFTPVGLAAQDGELALFPPRKATSKNFSIHPPRTPAWKRTPDPQRVRCPVARLATLTTERGHAHVDVLKLDIEGAELEAVPELLRSGPPVGQLLLELHYGHPAVPYGASLGLLEDARRRGYRVLDVSPRGYELTLVHREWPFSAGSESRGSRAATVPSGAGALARTGAARGS